MENINENDFSQPIEETPEVQTPQIEEQVQTDNAGMEEMPEPKKSHVKAIIISVVAALVVICGGCGAYYVINKAKEQRAYDSVKNSTNLTEVEEYIDKFDNFLCPNRTHLNEIKNLYDELKEEEEDWSKVAKCDDVDELIKYIRDHAGSHHEAEAKNLVDSISWGDALRLNDEDAYLDYLDITNYEGKHADEAREFLNLQVSDYEKDDAIAYLNNFFSALSYDDEEGLTHCMASSFTYNGKNVSKSAMLDVMESLHSDGVSSISIESSEEHVKKLAAANNSYDYSIDFEVDMHLSYDTSDGYYYDESTGEWVEPSSNKKLPTYKNYKGTATINQDGKVTSFSWTKIAEHSKDVR